MYARNRLDVGKIRRQVINLYIFPKANTTVAFYGENTTVVVSENCQATFPGLFVTEEGNKKAQGDIMG